MKSKNLWARRVGRLLGAGVVLSASGLSLAAIDLNPTLTGPATYTPGTNDASYTLTVANDGGDPEADATITTNFPGTVNVTWTCTAGANSMCPNSGNGNIAGGGFEIADGESLTFAILADFDSGMTNSPLTVTATATNSVTPMPVTTSNGHTSTLSRLSDLTLAKSSSNSTYTPGESSPFTVTVANAGPSDAAGVTLADNAPAGTSISGWTCTPSSACPAASGAGNISESLDVPAGQTATFTVTVAYPSSLQAETSTNTATMTVPANLNDPDGTDPVDATASLTRAAESDLSLAFTGTLPATFIPGAAAGTDFQFTVTNSGPSDTAGAVLPLRWGDLAASVSWSCAPLAACSAVGQIEVPDGMGGTVFEPTDNTAGDGAGTGDEDLIVDLAASGSVVISVSVQFASAARTNYVYSPAIFASAGDPPTAADEPDPDTSNNAATLTLTPNRQADIAVDKIGLITVNPGSSFAYDLVVSNLGPSDVGADPLLAASAGEIGILLEDLFDPSLLGGLAECADTSAPCWEACSSDSGGATGVTDFDLTNCPTTLISSGGDIQDLRIALKAGHSTLIRAFVRTDQNASGQVDNTATVSLDPADGVTEPAIGGVTDNNSDSVTSNIDRSSDLSVTKTDGVTTAVAGEVHSYTIVVENNGFITGNAVELEDQLPTFNEADFAAGIASAGFEPNSLTWQCQAFNGACCNSNSTNCGAGQPTDPISIFNDPVDGSVLRNEVDLPGRSRVEFTVTGTLDSRASGTLSNTASITPPVGLNDPLASNDTDTDDDTQLERQAAISVTKSLTTLVGVDSANPESPPFALAYLVEVENNGPSYVPGVRVVDPLSDTDFDQTTADWECAVVEPNPGQTACAAAAGSGTLDATVDLDPGGKIDFIVRVETEPTASGSVTNTARAELQSGEQFFSEAVRTSLIGTAELVITKTDNRSEVAPGDPVTYSIKVRNEGPDDVLNATVVDEFPLVIDSLAWSCQAVTPVPGDISPLRPLVPGFTPGNGLVTSPDGRHVYVIGTSTGRLFAFDRNNVPGAGFGDVTLIETEINGVDDTGDAGAVVSGMERPLDIAMSPDGLNVYALSKPETVPEFGLVDQFATSRWSAGTQTFGCGSSSVSADSASVELNTANGCAAISASYTHDGVDEAGTVTFDWTVDQSQAHSYEARAGVSGDTLQTLTTSTPAVGTTSFAVVPGDQVTFNVFKNSGTGISTLRITNFEFVPADAAPPTLAVFGRSTNPAASNFGELMFLGSFSEGLPEEPTSLSMNNGNLYVSGAGNPSNVDDDGDPIADSDDLISIFDRDAISGLPVHDFIQLSSVPSNMLSLSVDPAGGYLFAGGDSLQMFTIDAAQAGLPEGRLTAVGNLPFGTDINSLVAVDDAPHLYARAVVGGSPQLVMVRFLDTDGNPVLSLEFNYTAASLGLPANAISSAGSIAVSPDGEHVAGVSADDDLLYILRRDANPEPGGGGLSFQESRANLMANDENSGLILATDVVFAPDGRHVLVAPAAGDENTNPALAVFNRRAPDPLFAFLENDRQTDADVSGITAPNDIAVSPDGAHVYSVSLPDNSLTRFNRFPRLGLTEDTQGMHLQYAETYADGFGGVSGLDQPRRVLISPDGASVFVTSEANDTIAVFTRDNDRNSAQYGELHFVEVISDADANVDGLNGAQGMAMDPASRHLYVAGTFDNAIARFERDPADGSLIWRERVVSGENGVVGLSGIRDIAVTADGLQLLGVSTTSNALVVFDRDSDSGSSSFGELTFVQAQLTSIGVRPVALAIPNGTAALGQDAHVYVVGQNSNTLAVLRRVTDASSSAFGQVQPIDLLTSGEDGIAFMRGPNDVQVSPDGKRVYVAAEASDAVLVFDRDLNLNSSRFGAVSPVEIRRDSVRGVDGIRGVRALGVSADSRNVYAAGFGEGAVASFRLGTGSVCTAGGSGTINDQVDIGVGGTIEYRATGVVRPTATAPLVNTASVAVPDNFIALNPQTGCPNGGDYCATDTTTLVPEGTVTIDKSADGISFVAGDTAAYTITINNSGPSSLVHSAGAPLTVSDLLDDNEAFVDGSAVWRCEATGSGSLEFLDAYRNLDPQDPTTGPFDSLEGISGLALVPGTPGNWLVGASVLDDSLSVFTRDAITGELLTQTTLATGDMLGGQPVDFLNGVQSVVASDDGAFLYLASRASDAVTVLSLSEGMGGEPVIGFVQSINSIGLGEPGLDQAVHLVLSADTLQSHVYVAGANDDAIAVFERDETSGQLTWVQSVQEGLGGVTGLLDVSHLVLSTDGLHLYALSPTSGSIALFDRDASGLLSLRRIYDGADLGIAIDGVSSAVLDAGGQYLYVAAELASRIVVLERDTSAGGSAGELVLRSSVAQDENGVNGLVGVRQLAITTGSGNPNNIHVYATSQATSSVAWFIRDAADGSLDFGGLRGNQGSTPTGLGGATGIVVDEFLGQIFVAGTADAAVSRFQRQADSFCPASGTGELENVSFNVGAGGSVTFFIEVELASEFTGLIDPVSGDNTGTIENVATLVAAADPLNPTQDSTATSVIDTIADLAITKTDNLREFDGLAGATSIAGTNKHVYTGAPGDNGIGMFVRNVDPGQPGHGRLEFRQAAISGEGNFEGINDVADLAVSGDGRQVYATSKADNSLVTIDLDADSGEMTFGDVQQNGVFGVSGLSGATAVATSPDGAHVYALGGFSNAIVAFARETDELSEDFGRLTFLEFEQNGVGGVAGMGAPIALALSGDGRHVYVVGEEADTLAVFQRTRLEASANFGRLEYQTHYTNGTDGVTGLESVRDVVVSADGTTVYVLGAETGTLARFTRDSATGELDWVEFLQDGTGGVIGLTGARSMLLDDMELSLYVAGEAAGAITRFDVDGADGSLSFGGQIANGDPAPATGGSVFGLEGVTDLFQALDGDHVYAASSGRDAVLTFAGTMSASRLDFEQIVIDGLGGVAPGDTVEYVIRVENRGPSNVPQARVIDLFPDSFDSVTWSCSPDNNPDPDITAACLTGFVDGDVDAEVQLSAGASATIRATGIVSAAATGRLINTATISAEGVQDSVISNNSATDDDTVLSPSSDLIMTVDNGIPGPAGPSLTPGGTVDYAVTVHNAGPSSVRGVFVEDQFPAALFDTTWSCTAVPAAGILADPLDADPGFVPAALAITGDGRWAYAVGGNFIEVIRRDPLTGNLDRDPVAGTLDSAQQLQNGVGGVVGISGGNDIVINGDGRFVYVAGGDSDSIALFERDGTTGELEFVDAWFDGQATTQGIGGIKTLLLSADGNYLYAAGSLDSALAIFAIDNATGGLVQTGFLEQGEDGVDGLAGITDMTFAADQSLLLVVADANQSLTTFQRDASSGDLVWAATLLNDDLIGTDAENSLLGAASIIEADDEILVASRSSDLVGRFALVTETEEDIETTLPEPTGVIDAAALGEALISPLDLAWDPDQSRLYIAAPGEVVLLSLIAEAEVVDRYSVADHPVLDGVSTLLLGPAGRQLQTLGTRAAGEIGIWARERGSRCPLSGSGDLGRQQVDIVAGGTLFYTVSGTIQPNATGSLDYTVSVENPSVAEELNPADNTDTDSDPLTAAPDLAVTKSLETAPVVAGLPVAWSIGFGNAGLSDAMLAQLVDAVPVFPTDNGGIVADSGSWSCDANTPLSTAVEFALPDTASAIAVDDANGFLYATSAANDALLAFPLAAGGTPGTPVRFAEGDIADPEFPDLLITGLGGASDVAVSNDGLHVYVTGEIGNSVVVFGREDADSPLEYLQTFTTTVPQTIDSVPGLRGARSVAMSGDEKFVFVAGSISDAVAVFERDPQSGQLSFVERVFDGTGTIVPEFNVIQGVSGLHATGTGNDLYAIAAGSEAITRFRFNADSGVMAFESVLRAGGPIPDLAGIRDLAASPGDSNIYVLVDAGIAIFTRQDDGSLVFDSLFDVGPGLVQATALLVDRAGSRAYLLDEGGGSPVIHVLRRDWNDGSLEFWFTQPIVGGAPRALVQQPGQKRLLVAGDGPSLLRFEEQALSRCLTDSMIADGIDTEVDLGATGWSTFDLDATVHPSARGTLDNSVTATPGDGADPDTGNNTATVSAPITIVSDIAITKTGPADAVAGEPIAYQIMVTNTGPSSALGIVITDIAPAALEQIEWTCAASDGSTCPANGMGAPAFSADVLPDGQLDIVLNAVIDPGFIGLMTNAVELTPEPDATDPTPGDHADSVDTEVIAVADVSVTKTTLTAEVVAGLPVSWRIDAINNGPSDAPSVDIADTLPPGLSDVTWTCTAAAGASCPANGVDAPDFNAVMPVGGSLEILIDADLAAAAIGNLVNTVEAVVGAPVNEPDLSNNSATARDLIAVRADMAIELTAPRNPFDPGGPIELPLNVAVVNLGPSDSRNVDVIIDFSAPVQQTSPGCTQPLATRVRCLISQLDPGATRTLELSLTGLPQAPSTLVVDGLVLTSAEDVEPLNDTDSVSIELVTGIDLDVSVDNGFSWLSPGQAFDYLIRIDNFGSVDAGTVDVSVPVPAELLDAEWTCTPTGAASCSAADLGGIVDVAAVPSGDSVTYRLGVLVDPLIDLTVPQSATLTASADPSPPGDDINPINNIDVDQDEIRLVMFEDGFEAAASIPVRVKPVEAAMSCFSIDVGRDSSAPDTPLRLLDAHSPSGARLLWLDLSRRGTQPWLQLSVMQADGLASSGWMAWPAGEDSMAIRIDDGRAELSADDATLWTAAGRLPDALSLVRRASLEDLGDEPMFQVTDCSSRAISAREVR